MLKSTQHLKGDPFSNVNDNILKEELENQMKKLLEENDQD